ncbi:histidine phosphatase family protein [Paenibacillus sp. CF384]|uniref:histidine phosphatase family protein n=1 Tax=Paenibacillus sp. CF384 TaxID=1884382 RepID=UPI00089A981E|nr:histidine phosphatase family protein [Paenibacillus sp. CF384]SDW96716.1 probable phosphoglycerate mutase [Paenibacillus sp. CF384]
MKIYIIRHAEPDYPNNTITAPGHLEAKALAERLSGTRIDRIYSSPLGRALHTMQYTADKIGLEATVLPWLEELGGWQMKNRDGQSTVAWNADHTWVREHRPFPSSDDWHERAPYNDPSFAGRFQEIKDNSDQFFLENGYRREGGRYKIEHSNRDTIAIFCHLGFGLAWLSHLLELPLPMVWSGFWIAPSSVTTVVMEEYDHGWAAPRCYGIGDVGHLYHAALPLSRAGLIANNID